MAPNGIVVRVEIDGCEGGHSDASKLRLQMMWPMSTAVKDGFVVNSVWRISVHGLPSRYVRLTKGKSSLISLLEKYSFTDDKGCAYSLKPEDQIAQNLVHNAQKVGELGVDASAVREAMLTKAPRRRTRWYRADRDEVLRYAPKDHGERMGTCHFQKMGIAQLSEVSGICWYSSLWYSLLSPPDMYTHLQRHMQRRRSECEHCAHLCNCLPKILHSQAESEAVRRYIYDRLSIGDDPSQAGELDGQNGGSMCALLFGALKVPMITVLGPWLERADIELNDSRDRKAPMPPDPQEGDRAILMVRTYRNRWQAPETLLWPPRPTMGTKQRNYVLQSALIGSELCGHQIAIARSCEPETWSVSDSDGIRLGILPIAFRKPASLSWHALVPSMIPYSNATRTSEFCDMSPGGRHPLKVLHDTLKTQGLERYLQHVDTESTAHDLINVDYVYLEAE